MMQGLRLFRLLADLFWPGPLTIVARAISELPPEITAFTGFVGVRVPANSTAQLLLRAAGVPVAAPSANRFGHVSPTRASHVLDDLGSCDITVLLGEEDRGVEKSGGGGQKSCNIGIESTVVKIEEGSDGVSLVVFRLGGVPLSLVRAAIMGDAELRDTQFIVRSVHQSAKPVVDDSEAPALQVPGAVAPGMLLTHYAPDVRCFLMTKIPHLGTASSHSDASELTFAVLDSEPAASLTFPVSGLVVLDCGATCKDLCGSVLAYRDLAPGGDFAAARTGVFDALRWAESVPGALAILLADPFLVPGFDRDDAEALRDRLFRACSGVCVSIDWSSPACCVP
jgi:L-threonylcarbamoyladenylate synthase